MNEYSRKMIRVPTGTVKLITTADLGKSSSEMVSESMKISVGQRMERVIPLTNQRYLYRWKGTPR